MTDDIDELLKREPFVAFRVVLTNGSHYDVTSPLQLVPEGPKLTYFFARSDRYALLRLNQLAAIETLSE